MFCRALKASGPNQGLTYAQAGVSVDAGNTLVEVIKPFVRSTRRSGADAEIGGFGGVFDLKATGYIDPVLVSGTDGVGTKLRVAVDAGIHDSVGVSLFYFCLEYSLRFQWIGDRRRLGRDVCERPVSTRRRASVLPRLLWL